MSDELPRDELVDGQALRDTATASPSPTTTLDTNCMEGLRAADRTGEVPENPDSDSGDELGCMVGFFEQELGSWEDAIMIWNAHDVPKPTQFLTMVDVCATLRV